MEVEGLAVWELGLVASEDWAAHWLLAGHCIAHVCEVLTAGMLLAEQPGSVGLAPSQRSAPSCKGSALSA